MAIQRRRQPTNSLIHPGIFELARALQEHSNTTNSKHLISRSQFPYLSCVPTFHPRISTKYLEPVPWVFQEFVQNEETEGLSEQALKKQIIEYLTIVLRCDALSIGSHLMEIFYAVVSPNSSTRPALLTGNALKIRFLHNADQIINSVKKRYADIDRHIQQFEMEQNLSNGIKNVAANFSSVIQDEAEIFKRRVCDIIDEYFVVKLNGTSGRCTLFFACKIYKFFLDSIVDSEKYLFTEMCKVFRLDREN